MSNLVRLALCVWAPNEGRVSQYRVVTIDAFELKRLPYEWVVKCTLCQLPFTHLWRLRDEPTTEWPKHPPDHAVWLLEDPVYRKWTVNNLDLLALDTMGI